MTLRFIPGVHRVTHRVALHVEQLADPRVNQAEAHVLAYLSESDAAATISDVHRAFAHKRSTLTSILDRLERRGFSEEVRHELRRAYRLLFQSRLNVSQAVERGRSELEPLPEVMHLLDFIEQSARGVTL